MNICGIEFDDPLPEEKSGRDYSEHDEGKRTRVRTFWLSTWEKDSSGGISRRRIPATITNRGAVTFDGKIPKENVDREKVKTVFDVLDGKRTLFA